MTLIAQIFLACGGLYWCEDRVFAALQKAIVISLPMAAILGLVPERVFVARP
jgi:hypothetical protein